MIRFESKIDELKLAARIDSVRIDIDKETLDKVKKIHDGLDAAHKALKEAAEKKYGSSADIRKISKNADILQQIWIVSRDIVRYSGKRVTPTEVKYVLSYLSSYNSISSEAKKEAKNIIEEIKRAEEIKKAEENKVGGPLTDSQKQQIKKLKDDWDNLRYSFGNIGVNQEGRRMRNELYSAYIAPLEKATTKDFDKLYNAALSTYNTMLQLRKSLTTGGIKWPTGFKYAR